MPTKNVVSVQIKLKKQVLLNTLLIHNWQQLRSQVFLKFDATDSAHSSFFAVGLKLHKASSHFQISSGRIQVQESQIRLKSPPPRLKGIHSVVSSSHSSDILT